MKKIRLNVDELEVLSFATDGPEPQRGTVRGHDSAWECPYTAGYHDSCYQACFPRTEEYETCYQSGHTCGASCDWPCNSIHVCPSDTGGCG